MWRGMLIGLLAMASLLVFSGGAGAPKAAAVEPGTAVFYSVLRQKARAAAKRTYIHARDYGSGGRYKRRFYLRGQDPVAVRSRDGFFLTAFQATLNSANGTGDIVLLYRGLRFVGWASNRATNNLSLARRNDRIVVKFAVYRMRDATCCPSGVRPVTYRWNGSRIVQRGKPPLVYGEPGQRLHMGPRARVR